MNPQWSSRALHSQSQFFMIISVHGYGDNGDLIAYLKLVRLVPFFARNLVIENSLQKQNI
jgi:hypothetical protein